jgi:hypothetical protein
MTNGKIDEGTESFPEVSDVLGQVIHTGYGDADRKPRAGWPRGKAGLRDTEMSGGMATAATNGT